MTNLSLEHFENGIKVCQDENLYKFTSDAIKLAKFCKTKRTDNVLDMCAGCGVVGLYAYSIAPFNKLYFNDIQEKMCELINKNIKLNNLSERCTILCKHLNNLSKNDFEKPLDVILCNPPYFKLTGKVKQNENVAMCRHEIATNLQQITKKAGELIKVNGKFYIIIPADRLCECVIDLKVNGFEVKRMQICHSGENATVCLIESVKYGKSGVKIKVVNEMTL
ncbi:MAG: methyltransferase [Clostridia bacterium]|nr:methyltransferase [Clostridia bacterium]